MTKVLLTLVGAKHFSRRDLKGPDGVTAGIKKGDTIAVTEAVADILTGEDYGTHDSDGDFHPMFKVNYDESAKLAFDFTVEPEAKTAAAPAPREVTHNDGEGSEVSAAQAASVGNQVAKRTTGQRSRAAAKK